MVRVAGEAAVAPLGRAVQDFKPVFAVPWPAAEAARGRDKGGRKFASLSMNERCAAANSYNEA
jgi:hypothetical protein